MHMGKLGRKKKNRPVSMIGEEERKKIGKGHALIILLIHRVLFFTITFMHIYIYIYI